MVLEYRVLWNSGGANPGYTVFHGRPQGIGNDQAAAEELALRARTLFVALGPNMPDDYNLAFPGEVVELNTSTGELEDVYNFAPLADVQPPGTGAYSAASGARIEWRTQAIVNGRRLRGRTYVVPLLATLYETDGTITNALISSMQSAANAYWSAGGTNSVQPCVWSRTHGILGDITSAIIPDEVSIMRSRRD